MRVILLSEIKMERANASAFGAVNAVLSYKSKYQGKEYTFKLGKNQYGVTVANRYENGKKTTYSQPIKRVYENIKNY